MFNSGEEYVYTLRQKCYSFGSWFVGMSGGVGLAYVTEVHKTAPLFTLHNNPKVEPFFKQIPNYKYFIGSKNLWVRLALQGIGCALGHRRTVFDTALAAGITGGAFGLRGVPGGHIGAGTGAAAFAIYAVVMHVIFR